MRTRLKLRAESPELRARHRIAGSHAHAFLLWSHDRRSAGLRALAFLRSARKRADLQNVAAHRMDSGLRVRLSALYSQLSTLSSQLSTLSSELSAFRPFLP